MAHILIIGAVAGLAGGAIGIAIGNKKAGILIAGALSAIATLSYMVIV